MTFPFLGSFGPAALMGGNNPASISFVDSTGDDANADVYTFTDHATGTAAGNRSTIVVVHGNNSAAAGFSVSGVTVGGVAATEVIDSDEATSSPQAAIYIIANPTGTTATIVVTFSESISSAGVSVFAAYNLLSLTATATATQFQTASAAIDLSLNVLEGGIAVGGSMNNSNAATATWTGFTERSDEATGGGTNSSLSSADYTATANQSPLTVSCDITGVSDSTGVAAAFR